MSNSSQLESVFFAALEKQSPAERIAFLDQACAADEELRRRVERMLAAQAAAGSFLEQPAIAADATAIHERPISESPGTIIGPYKLRELLAEGGMGSVFVAEQEAPVRRKVALKVIKPGMDSRQVLGRFEAERQTLALMDHPHIAKVLDAGTTDTGRPYFVMELVRGVPITEFCDQRRLDPRQRLELFVQVCRAIQHAHQKGIIHRDIKPSNILVTLHDDLAVPKVIDFGIAKATNQQLTEQTIYTAFNQMIGTPLYMSPEQAEMNALDVDTRSDVYSLGVLLYELLTGSTPFDNDTFRQAGFDEMRRLIREVDPPRPSQRVSTLGAQAASTVLKSRGVDERHLSRVLHGELDWIVMKALEKDRSRRYESASALAADVQRHLNDEPVDACPPSRRYRLRKFLRKHKGSVVALSLIFAALLAGVIGTTIGLLEARNQRAKANELAHAEAAQRKIAEQAEANTLADYRASTDYAIEQLIGSKPELGPKEKAYLENTLKRWQGYANRQGDDERTRAIRGEGHFRVARLWAKLGRNQEAQAEYLTALELEKKLAEQFPAVPVYQEHLASTHRYLGNVLASLGKFKEARAEFLAALELGKKLVEHFPDVPDYRHALVNTHLDLGNLLDDLAERKEARAEVRAALELEKKLVEQFPAVPKYQRGLAVAHGNLGNLLNDLGKREEARAEFRAAIELEKKLVEQFPAVPKYRDDLANPHNNLGSVLADLGKLEEARAEYLAAIELEKKLVEQYPDVSEYQISLGSTSFRYGETFFNEGKPAEGLEWYDLAIRTLQPVYEKEPRDVTAKQFLIGSHQARAVAYSYLDKPAESIKDWDRCIDLAAPNAKRHYRAGRTASQIKVGMVAEAVAEVAVLSKTPNWIDFEWYNFACVYSLASVKIADKKQEYADRAMEMLQKAVQAGYNNAAEMAKDADLDPLRDREDFKQLLSSLPSPDPKSEAPTATPPKLVRPLIPNPLNPEP